MNPIFTRAAMLSLVLAGYLPMCGSAQVLYQDLHLVPDLAKAHGLTMGLAFVVVWPLGALLIRVFQFKGSVWVHVACQLIGWILMIAGLVLGIRVGKILDRLHNNTHTIFGTVIVALMLLQPFFGFVHHRRYLATQKRGNWTRLHVWYGRVLILLGIINGGLGLQLAANTRGGTIAYGVVGGVIGMAYCVMVAKSELEKRVRHEKASEPAILAAQGC